MRNTSVLLLQLCSVCLDTSSLFRFFVCFFFKIHSKSGILRLLLNAVSYISLTQGSFILSKVQIENLTLVLTGSV